MTNAIQDALDRQRAACQIIRQNINERDVSRRQDRIVDGALVVECAAREIQALIPIALGAIEQLSRQARSRSGGPKKAKARR